VARVAALRKHYPEAEDACARSLLLDPKQPEIAPSGSACASSNAPGRCARRCRAGRGRPGNSASAASALCISDDPAEQLAAAQRHPVNRAAPPGAAGRPQGYLHRKLRIGYLCSDFSSHAAARLTAELYGLHQREQFEIYGFSWNEEDRSGLRARIAGRWTTIRLTVMSDLQAAQTIRAHEIDILVDLHGLGADGRPGILAHKPAPVQISWLGHPGSSAMPAVDYVLADAFVLPPQLHASFTERPLYLPDCVQSTTAAAPSARRPAAPAAACPTTPLCSAASTAAKLSPAQFAAWMRILRAPDSVLWLAADSEPVRDNLRIAALRHGVASERRWCSRHARRTARTWRACNWPTSASTPCR
jgi:predicted O-linked N-acetylglucosamine transferase (SPINDLY family)